MKTNLTSRAPRAFTLIEILMALAIFALVMSAIYSTFMLILRGSQAGLKATAEVQRERMTMHTIEQALTSARSFQPDGRVDPKRWLYGFVAENGTDAKLTFVARLPRSFPRSGRFGDFDVRRVEFALENGPESQRQLVLRQRPILMEFDQDEAEHPLVLAKEVKELAFEYWDGRSPDSTDEWTRTNELPKLIKVTLRLSSPGQRNGTANEEIVRLIAPASITVPLNALLGNPAGRPGMPGNPTPTPRVINR